MDSILDRQTRTYGKDSINKIINSIIGIYCNETSDLLFEVLKNLILSGINNIIIFFDSNINDNNVIIVVMILVPYQDASS